VLFRFARFGFWMLGVDIDGTEQALFDVRVRRAQVGERAVHVEGDAQRGLQRTYNTASA
jgi:hypothetical protein